jgi:hypothetical protein
MDNRDTAIAVPAPSPLGKPEPCFTVSALRASVNYRKEG